MTLDRRTLVSLALKAGMTGPAAQEHADAVIAEARAVPPLAEIAAERRAQDAQWGGPAHDDGHSLADWTGFITHQLERFWQSCLDRGDKYLETPDARSRLVKIAALAIAALESDSRKKAAAAGEARP